MGELRMVPAGQKDGNRSMTPRVLLCRATRATGASQYSKKTASRTCRKAVPKAKRISVLSALVAAALSLTVTITVSVTGLSALPFAVAGTVLVPFLDHCALA